MATASAPKTRKEIEALLASPKTPFEEKVFYRDLLNSVSQPGQTPESFAAYARENYLNSLNQTEARLNIYEELLAQQKATAPYGVNWVSGIGLEDTAMEMAASLSRSGVKSIYDVEIKRHQPMDPSTGALVEGDPVPLLINKRTGQPVVPGYAFAGMNESGGTWGGTFAGRGSTRFNVDFVNGVPVFTAQQQPTVKSGLEKLAPAIVGLGATALLGPAGYGLVSAPLAGAIGGGLGGIAAGKDVEDVLKSAALGAIANEITGNVIKSAEIANPFVQQAVASGVKTALSGGDLEDVLKSAAVGGVGSAATSAIDKTIEAALPEGTNPAISNALTKGIVAELTGKDPLLAIAGTLGGEALKSLQPPVSDVYPEEFQRGTAKDILADVVPVSDVYPEEFERGTVRDISTDPKKIGGPDFIDEMISPVIPAVAAPTAAPEPEVAAPAPTPREPLFRRWGRGAIRQPEVAPPPVTMESPTAGMSDIEQLIRAEEAALVPEPAVAAPSPAPSGWLSRRLFRGTSTPAEVAPPPVTMESPTAGMSDIEQLIRAEEAAPPSVMQPVIDEAVALADQIGTVPVSQEGELDLGEEEPVDILDLLSEIQAPVIEDVQEQAAEEAIAGDIGADLDLVEAAPEDTGLVDYEETAGEQLAEAQTNMLPYDELAAMDVAEAQTDMLPYDELAALDVAEAQQRTGGGEDVLYQEEAGKDLGEAQQNLIDILYQEDVGKAVGEAQQKFLESGEVLEDSTTAVPVTVSPPPSAPPPSAPPPAPPPSTPPSTQRPAGLDLLSLLSMLGMMGAQSPKRSDIPEYQYADIGEITPFEELFTPYSGTAPKPTQRRV